MPKPITLTLALTLAFSTTPAFAQGPSEPEFLPNTGSSAPFSRAVQVGDTLYLAGQLGIVGRSSTDQTKGIEAETRRAMERIGGTLAEFGLTHDALFKCTVWLSDIDDFSAFNSVYKTYFKQGRYPVRSTMAVKDLAAGALIEIECTAHNPRKLAGPTIAWDRAEVHFHSGEARSTNVYTVEDAAVCVGRWRLHADALDDGAFPTKALQAFPQALQLQEAIAEAEFFRLDNMVPEASGLMRDASDEAEGRLHKALGGDREAFQSYFEALGLCWAKPEAARDHGVGARDAPVQGAAEGPAG